MRLRELLAALPYELSSPDHPALEAEVKGLCTNSHACQAGDVFIGMPGTRVDGGEFWASAITAGAIAALVSPSAAQATAAAIEEACVITIPDIPRACAHIAAAFYHYPAQHLQMVGVTGTNGKTTTTHLIEFFLTQAQRSTALFGTLYTRWPGYQQTASFTTPFALELQQQLAAAVAAGSQFGVMEVSSHALAQGRVWGCAFETAVFTNLTQDHLDYHHNLEDYFAAKALLFSPDYLKGRAILNQDDPFGRRLIEQLDAEQVWTYSTYDSTADLWTGDLVYDPDGVRGLLHTPSGELEFRSPLVGQFNLANLLAAVGAGLHLGLELESMVQALPQFPGVPGRMERVQVDANQDISVIVDYAHTPDSLENLLKAARPFISGRMICVFGCGGDRDRTKRPLMGAIAANLSDWAIVTSDNPRTEDPERILQDILAGIPETANPLVLGDRTEAIREAILQANPGDGVLIAGKGHEDYQILGTEKVHFDDREQARTALDQRLSASTPS
ncbi:UDP-N-acetylmuramoyl-L-alanyl-D-glutamate--2,6-diaminopimelate ligase [Oculatella sp. LEGE 06141]|uniref:UDP-N-acetylmuramoyl-L-alanyl-D-glutamate--2, 6-diaminopimelate ligase n=1 Tax=Oculatella sp. LEGE 06141 TaxID=1828648 RepID=UPI001880B7C9|nr:UDP-N-acetylmuramoyl-L-alanyl-D-glutamate--2,6-diaminopimelate ligase [Oculatella sp. LEGE 06141]MBE9179014.1 UDP-N-acetylmuramoyl-L-alanyl-D-glutamate--2,6-diaminopimelate ligase [Oculatella sp. LEGE 06141]